MSGEPVDDELSSGSGDEVNIINGNNSNKRTPAATAPSGSGPAARARKRSRSRATGDSIVEAMLEIAAASKMRAEALNKKTGEDKFSISKCIKALDDLQDNVDIDIQLDEMELVAAAAGYLYFQSRVNQPTSNPPTRMYLKGLLQGPTEVCSEALRMDKRVFHKLSAVLRKKGMLKDTAVTIEEQVAIFLSVAGHNERIRVVQEKFQYSCETICRQFSNVLKAVKALSRELLQTPSLDTHPEIVNSKRLYPYFKDCIGVIDGFQVPAHIPVKDQTRFRNKKGVLTQNVLAACTFDLQFTFVCPGWEGSIEDSSVLRAVLDDPKQNFPQPPQGKYYLVDRDYTNREGFITPYSGTRYGLHEYRGASHMPQNAHDLFNHRHMSLSKTIHRSFRILNTRFAILQSAPQYPFHVQRDLVIATCALHNFIKREDGINDWIFASDGEDASTVETSSSTQQQEEVVIESLPMGDPVADSMRDSIAFTMWDDFMYKWQEW